MNINLLKNSLYWQQVVLNQSRDPVQIARVKKRIIELDKQISKLLGEST
jgi:hypothetical protein